MTDQNSINFNSSDFTVTSSSLELKDTVIKSAASDSGTATPSGNVLSIVGTNGISTSGSGSTITVTASGATSACELITSTTMSADSSLSFTDLVSTYQTYCFSFRNVIVSATADFRVRTSTNNGSSYDTGASDYSYQIVNRYGSTKEAAYDFTESFIKAINNVGTTSARPLNIDLYLYNASAALYGKLQFFGHCVAPDDNILLFRGGGFRKTAADVDAIQFYPSTGTMTSASVCVYGWRNA